MLNIGDLVQRGRLDGHLDGQEIVAPITVRYEV